LLVVKPPRNGGIDAFVAVGVEERAQRIVDNR